jgi:hypothetical protein
MIWFQREPTLQEILSDPITQAVMRADGVEAGEVEAVLRGIAQLRSGVMEGTRPRPVLTRNLS